jgi:hypothetical protein
MATIYKTEMRPMTRQVGVKCDACGGKCETTLDNRVGNRYAILSYEWDDISYDLCGSCYSKLLSFLNLI